MPQSLVWALPAKNLDMCDPTGAAPAVWPRRVLPAVYRPALEVSAVQGAGCRDFRPEHRRNDAAPWHAAPTGPASRCTSPATGRRLDGHPEGRRVRLARLPWVRNMVVHFRRWAIRVALRRAETVRSSMYARRVSPTWVLVKVQLNVIVPVIRRLPGVQNL